MTRALTHALAVAFLAALADAALTGCPTGPHDQGPPTPTPIGPNQAQPPGEFNFPGHQGRPYDVVPGESLLTILAFRGGALAKVGHNHVIASHDVTGTFYVPEDPLHTTFELHVPVAQLAIDEPQLRAKEGPEFPTDVPQSAKEGTRHNMLSDALLDGANYPEITLAGRHIGAADAASRDGGDGAVCAAPDHAAPDHAARGPAARDYAAQGCAAQAELQVTIRGQAHALWVPVFYSLQRSQLEASGELAIKQTDLGLTPFNAMLGALQVQDELHVRFKLVARSGSH